MTIRRDTAQLENADGLALHFRSWIPEGNPPKGAVLIVHGFAEHVGRYEWIAGRMAESGWAVHAYDQRGHGRSQGKRGFINRFAEYTDDLDQMIDTVRRRAGVDRVILLAHSMGGLVAATRLIRTTEGVEAAAYSSPFFGLAAPVPGWKTTLGNVMSRVFPALALANEIDPNAISRDPREVAEYADDPLIFKIARARWFTECLQAQAALPAGMRRAEIPQLFLIAGADRLADAKRAMSIAGALPAPLRRIKRYEGAHHELFHDLCREEAAGDLLDWLNDPGRPSSAPDA